MMTITLSEFENRFKEIDKTEEPFRTKRLAVLMTDMEGVYRIPKLKNEAFNKKNKEIMSLYKKVSRAREFD